MATTNKIPFPVSKPLTPSGGDFTESWRQFFLALRDIASTSENFDPAALIVLLQELTQASQAQVDSPLSISPSVDELVAQVLAGMRIPPADVPSEVFTHGIQDQADLHALATQTAAGFMSAGDKLKVDGITASVEDIFVAGTDFIAGTTTSLTLSKAYGSKAAVLVHFDGTFQGSDQYSVSGNTITFTSAIPVGVSTVYARG